MPCIDNFDRHSLSEKGKSDFKIPALKDVKVSKKKNLPCEGDLDKKTATWEGDSYCIPRPIFFDGGGDMREEEGIVLFDLGQINQLFMLPEGHLGPYFAVIGQSIFLLRSFISDENNCKDYPSATAEAKLLAECLELLIKQGVPVLRTKDKQALDQLLTRFPTLLASERGKKVVILLEKRGGYDVDSLWKNSLEDLILEDILPYLSSFVKDNFKEAAKCLVLNCHTAVGFHSMRCVEQVARKYYILIMGKLPKRQYTKGGERDLGLGEIGQQLIERYIELEKQQIESGELGIIGPTLRALNKIYRRPIMHPEIKTLNPNQAVSTFEQMKGVVSMMVLDAKNGGLHINPPWAGEPF